MTSLDEWEDNLDTSVCSIDWLIKYLEALKAEGETHVFSLIYDRNDATNYFYDGGYGHDSDAPEEVTHDEWRQAVALLNGQDYGLADQVSRVVDIVVGNGEA